MHSSRSFFINCLAFGFISTSAATTMAGYECRIHSDENRKLDCAGAIDRCIEMMRKDLSTNTRFNEIIRMNGLGSESIEKLFTIDECLNEGGDFVVSMNYPYDQK